MHFNGEENPFPATDDAAYRKYVGGGPSHGHRQRAQKNWQRSRVWFRRYPRGQTDRPTDPQTYILITILRNRSRGRSKYMVNSIFIKYTLYLKTYTQNLTYHDVLHFCVLQVKVIGLIQEGKCSLFSWNWESEIGKTSSGNVEEKQS